MTLVEIVVVIFVIAILMAVFMPRNNGAYKKAKKISCANNLKQLGLAYKIWAGDHNDKYLMFVSVTNGGTMELMDMPDTWKVFQVMSNELSTPKILACPEQIPYDKAATNWGEDLKNHLSYFVSLDATDDKPSFLLSGDDNFQLNQSPVKTGFANLPTNSPVEWDTTRHANETRRGWFIKTKIGSGNLLLCDGSVQSTSNSTLTNTLNQTSLATNRIFIP